MAVIQECVSYSCLIQLLHEWKDVARHRRNFRIANDARNSHCRCLIELQRTDTFRTRRLRAAKRAAL
jgi:hypothetical protein